MSRTKDDVLDATGGLHDPLGMRVRIRIRALADKLKAGVLTEAEHVEYVRLVESLPDDDEYE